MNTRAAMRLWIALVAVALACGGCSVADQLRDRSGTDPQLLQAGVERETIHEALGAPLRTWKPNDTLDYELHAVRRPLKGSKSEAGSLLFLDLISFGATEGFAAMDKKGTSRDNRQEYHLVWFGFDANDRVFGVFREFAILPDSPG